MLVSTSRANFKGQNDLPLFLGEACAVTVCIVTPSVVLFALSRRQLFFSPCQVKACFRHVMIRQKDKESILNIMPCGLDIC